jgi:hypothetical protein
MMRADSMRTTELNEQYVDDGNECGLGAGVKIKVKLVCDCYAEARAELKEVLFDGIFDASGSPIYSRLGYNAIKLRSPEWNALYEFVHKAYNSGRKEGAV